MTTIWLDIDGVLADVVSAVCTRYDADPEQVLNYDFSPALEYEQARECFDEPHFWSDCAIPYDAAKQFCHDLKNLASEKNADFYIASNPQSEDEKWDKLKWVLAYFRDDNYPLLLKDKTRLFRKGDLVIDDSPDVLMKAFHIGCRCFAIARPWNRPNSNPCWTGARGDYSECLEWVEKKLTEG